MKKLTWLAISLLVLWTQADGATISRPTKSFGGTSFVNSVVPLASDFNGDIDTIYNDYNGNITNANISASAAIAGSKILPSFTANQDITNSAPCTKLIESDQGADLRRWDICVDAQLWGLSTMTDAGAVIITPITIARATGNVNWYGKFTKYNNVAPTDGQLLIGKTSTATFEAATLTGTTNQVTVTNGSGTIALSLPTPVVRDLTGNVTGNLTGNVTGNASTATTATALASDPTDCAANTFAQSIVANGNLTCATPNLGTADVTGTLTVNKGGTGTTTLTSNGVLLGNTTSPVTVTSAGAAGTVLHVNAAGGSPGFRAACSTQTFRGLQLRNHPDSDSTNTKLMLVHADEITLSDCTRVNPADRLVLDKTTIGAGGMQATAINSTWNKAYYIRKSSDGTEALFGLRAKDYFNDTSFTTTPDQNDLLRKATSTTSDKLAQGFQLATTGLVEFAEIKIITNTSAVSGNFWLTLETDSSGSPSGSVLATSDKYDASKIEASSAVVVRMPFRNPVSLTAATQYHLVLQGDYARSDTVTLDWQGLAAGGYTNGSAKRYNGSTWSAAQFATDFWFRVYVTRNDTALSLPSGYDQYAQIGWFYVDGSGNIKKFVQRDRQVFGGFSADWRFLNAVVSTGTHAAIATMDAFVPPTPVMMIAHGYGGSAVTQVLAILSAMDITAALTAEATGSVQMTTSTANYASTFPVVPVEYAALLYSTNGASMTSYVGSFTW